jgi:hypothetical protein
MEPVRYPATVSRVSRTDRIRRAQPRGGSGQGSAFARFLSRDTGNSEDLPPAPPAEPGEPAETPSEGGSPTPAKRVDIRV